MNDKDINNFKNILNEIIEKAMEKKDRYISIYFTGTGFSASVYPLDDESDSEQEAANNDGNAAAEKKGKWLTTDAYPHHVYCSECYKTYVTNEKVIQGRGWETVYCTEAEFCPHCGVKMETEQEAANNDRNTAEH